MGLLTKAKRINRLDTLEREKIRVRVEAFQETRRLFQGIILEAADTSGDNYSKSPDENGLRAVEQALNRFTEVVYLPVSGKPRVLLLFPASIDGALLAHRITHSFSMTILTVFLPKKLNSAWDEIAKFL